ncbi:MAG: hypothetical protein NXI03_04590 [Alphaproteobacteria bacterium]|nr:hypothetical protein [Alphaproteobacteria bacterium]
MAFATACDALSQNQVADVIELSRSTASELINAKRDLAPYVARLEAGLKTLGVTAPAEAAAPTARTGPTPDLGLIAWREKPGGEVKQGKVIFRGQMCARHWAIIGEDGEGRRVPLILRLDAVDSATVTLACLADGLRLSSMKMLGHDPHVGVERTRQLMAETALFYATGAGAYFVQAGA